jgi:spermidine synthase
MDFFHTFAENLDPTEVALGLFSCVLAAFVGIVLARKQARVYSGSGTLSASHPNNDQWPVVTFADYGDMRFLHLGTPAVQGSMKINKPFDIHLEYVQRMMAWLLFTELDQVKHMHAMQLGLGAASLTKFCHHHLGMQTTAIELNPQVIATCRRWFNLPENDARLDVVLGDAGEAASNDQWRGKIDTLQVDLYDQEAAQPVIDSEAFYRNCRDMLTDQGCMTVNLFGHAMSYADSLHKISAAFGEDATWAFKPTTAGNTIVLAFRSPPKFEHDMLQQQAQAIQARWPLSATKWLKALRPFQQP